MCAECEPGFLFLLDFDLFQRGEALGLEGEFLAAHVRGVGRIAEFLEQQRDGRGVRAAQGLAAQAHVANGVGAALDGELIEEFDDPLWKAIVHADNALAFDHAVES